MADIQVTNTDSDLSGNTLLTEEEAYTITGLHTYNRTTNPPFAVASGAAKVDNLDADKLDGVEGAEFLKRDGTVALTANWDAGAYEIRSATFESDIATGTAPLVIASTTKVANLNADLLDGQTGTYYAVAANVLLKDGSVALTANWDAGGYEIRSNTFESDVATGTAPLVIASTTKVANLNADLLDGIEGADLLKKDGTVALTANWDAGGYEIRSNTFESDVATGTVPLTIASTTLCANLNTDYLDGYHGSHYLAAANATGTLSVAQGGTGATSLTDNAILMGNGTGAVTPAFGISGYDATYPILNFQGVDPALYLTDTDSTRQVQFKHVQTSSTESLVILYGSEPAYASGQNLAYWDTDTGENTIISSANNLKLTNSAGTEHTRLGPNGISFDGGTDNLGRYDEGTFTPYYKEVSTATGQVAGTGKYLKIGDMVTIHMDFTNVTTGASSATGAGVIGGIPDIETAGGIGAPATHTLPLSGATNVFYLSGSVAYFYSINNNAGWGAESFRNSQAGIYLRTNHTYKIA